MVDLPRVSAINEEIAIILQAFGSRNGNGVGSRRVKLYPHPYPFSKITPIPYPYPSGIEN